MTRFGIIAGLFAAAVSAAPLAAGAQTISLSSNEPAQLELGGGGYDIDHNNTAGVFRGEYRFASKLWVLRPLLGEEVTTDGASYTYGGFGLDIFIGDHWVLTPNEAVGFWARGDKDSKNLGSWVEFRSGAELAYRLDDDSRVGLSFHHISNAGLTRRNPGEEELLINYSLPLPGLP
ncbi:MAG TPA: acyloxyacyl hydrolase [Aliidongia sp.]|nr:acyloxyacyl hydrolase [Aliidongia sp.]